MHTLIRFGMSGCLSTGIDFIIYMLLGRIGVLLEFAKFLSVFTAATISFFINRKWTFRFQHKTDWKLIGRYVITQLANVTANTTGNAVALYMLGNVYVAFVFATGCGFVVNFTLQKYFVFWEHTT